MKTHLRLSAASSAIIVVLALLATGCTKPAEPSVIAPGAGTTIGTVIDDSVITTSVMSALLAEPDVKSLDLKVETRKGEVQLSGFVDNQAQMDRAIAVARTIAGVAGVQSNMGLKGAARTVGVKVDDGIVTAAVKAALMGDAKVNSTDIGVVTRKGEVQLSGFVDNQSQIDRALIITRATQGVTSVSNEMSIKK